MSGDAIQEHEVKYLEHVEKKAFSPIGPLYTSLYEGLLARGLVHLAADGYILSSRGAEALAEWRRKH